VVELVGELRSGAAEHSWGRGFLRQRARVGEGAKLGVGKHRHRVRFEVPSKSPSSYGGQFLEVVYLVEVRVEIPWWPDKTVRFPLHVQALAEPEVEERGRVFVPSLEGAASDDAHFEFSLGSQVIEPGGRLHGAVAVSNTHAKRYRGFELELIARERDPYNQFEHRRSVRRWAIDSDERLGSAGETMPFQLSLPTSICPPFRVLGASIEWGLRATLKVAWGRDRSIGVPLHVRVAADGSAPTMAPVPVAVGDARATEMWRRATDAAGWDFGLGGVASREMRGFSLTASRRDAGKQRGLVRVDFEALGIDLGYDPGRTGGFVCWDSIVQGHLRQRLIDVVERVEIIDASDDHLVFAAGGAALEQAEVQKLLDLAQRVATHLEACFETLPPAARWEENGEALQKLAAGLGAQAEPWSCRVKGQFDEVPFEIRVREDWDLFAQVEPPFSQRESSNLEEGRVDAEPVYGPWRDQVRNLVREGGTLRMRFASGGGASLPIELATRLLEPLARRRDASLGGYR
jgi:hypothetical protein